MPVDTEEISDTTAITYTKTARALLMCALTDIWNGMKHASSRAGMISAGWMSVCVSTHAATGIVSRSMTTTVTIVLRKDCFSWLRISEQHRYAQGIEMRYVRRLRQ